MRKFSALFLAAIVAVTAAAPLSAQNGEANGQQRIQTTAPSAQPVVVPAGVPVSGPMPMQPRRGFYAGQIATGAIVGAVVIGGTGLALTNRRKGSLDLDIQLQDQVVLVSRVPFFYYTHGAQTHSHQHS